MCRRFQHLVILFLFQCCYCGEIFGKETTHHTKSFNKVGIIGFISDNKKILYYLEPNLRFVDRANKFETGYLETSIGLQISPSVSIWAGTETAALTNLQEHINYGITLIQKIIWNISLNEKSNLSIRARFDERKVENEAQIGCRYRHKIDYEHALDSTKKYSLLIFDEVFFNINHPSWGSSALIDQNRFSVGIRTQVNKRVSFKVEYWNQYQFNVKNQKSNVMNLALDIDNR